MIKTTNFQDAILNQIRRDKVLVNIIFTNGFQMKGFVKLFDNFVIVLETDGKAQLIYKHAISTVVPMSALKLENLES